MEDNNDAYDGGKISIDKDDDEGIDDKEGICEDDDDNDSEVSFDGRLDVSSGWFVCEDWSIIEVEMSTFFFLNDERKNDWMELRFGSLLSDDIKRYLIYFYQNQ